MAWLMETGSNYLSSEISLLLKFNFQFGICDESKRPITIDYGVKDTF